MSILTRRSFDIPTLAPAGALLQALADSGRSGLDLLVAFRAVSGFVTGFAQAELANPFRRPPAGTAPPPPIASRGCPPIDSPD
ncbi:hypothetical protein [Nocardia xishanensis]